MTLPGGWHFHQRPGRADDVLSQSLPAAIGGSPGRGGRAALASWPTVARGRTALAAGRAGLAADRPGLTAAGAGPACCLAAGPPARPALSTGPALTSRPALAARARRAAAVAAVPGRGVRGSRPDVDHGRRRHRGDGR